MKNFNTKNNKIAIVTASPVQVRYFLVNHIINLSKNFDLTIISNFVHEKNIQKILPNDLNYYSIPILREISLVDDIKSLLLLIIFFYQKRFKVVYSISPKGGLISMFAAWLVSVPIRIHTFTGQVWITRRGIMKLILKFLDLITASLANVVIVDSKSQCKFLIENHIVTPNKSIVLGDGSISGVNFKRFCPKPNVRKMVRANLNVSESTIIFLFIGRLKRDKGVFELAKAFSVISNKVRNMALWFVGPDEENIRDDIESILLGLKNSIVFQPYTTSPEDYMTASDIFCLPSYREGFGSTIIEAAACGLPAIGSNIYGITDAINDGETGFLVEKGDVDMLSSVMMLLANDPHLRKKLGEAAKKRVLEKFDQQRISDKLIKLIKYKLEQI